MRTNRISWLVALSLAAVLVVLTAFLLDHYCPSSGLALTTARREVHRLKNRRSFPEVSDFDSAVTLDEMLRPGVDEHRWSQTRAVRIEGYVVSVGKAGPELANCYSPGRRDIHINLALQMNAPASEQVVVEVTPFFERLAGENGRNWSEAALQSTLVGRWCRIEGWLFFDRQHAKESRNMFKEGSDLWRATAWEIHPVTKIEVLR